MIRLVLPVENADVLEKARPGLIFRTDLPYHTAKGELKYRKGWVKPEDSRALDRAKKKGDPSVVIGKYQYEEDMFDDGEGEAWEKPKGKAAEEAKPEPEAAPQPAPEPVAEAKPEPEAPAEEAKAPLYIEDLTEKAIIVRGDTRTHKDAIKAAGGRWNGKHGGWIFPKAWEDRVRARLAALLVPPKSAIITPADEPQKSRGHLGFFTAGGRRKELLEYWGGDIYTADLDDVIDVRTGDRIGRWEGPAWQKDAILTRLGLKAKEAPQEAPEAKVEENIKETPPDAPSKQESMPAGDSEQPSRVADRIAKPEVPDGEEAKTGDVQSDLEKPIAKMKFRDYGSWSAAGKHLSPAKRAALNQEIAELLNLPADEIEPKELDLIRQYSGFGGVKVEDERGVLYDFYTSPPVARMVWKLANKIVPLASGARVLEPSCGTGVFFDVAPQGVDLTGVEFDPRTAAAAGLLQPQARIYHASYEQFNLHEHEKFDAVVGNAPFGDRSVETQFLDESGEKSLDRYFISRSLDNLKSGGSMAMIVGPGVMDNSTSRDWRAKMLRKGQFIGAVRLPNESFKHTQTGVNPDVVMFRAYSEDVRARLATMSDEEMKQAGFFDEAFVEGGYFEENPAHRLGRVERGRFDSEVTVGKLDPADMDRAFEQFQPRDMKGREDFDRVRSMTEGRKVAEEAPGNLTAEEAAAVAAKTLRVGMTKTVNGKVYKLNANHRWELVDTAGPTARKLDRIKEIGEVVRAIRAAMRNDEPVDDLQRQARSLIESYEKEFNSKHTDDADIQRFLKANPSVAGVYEATTVSADSDLLTKQNVYNKEIEIVDGHRPAIRALLDMQRDMMDGTVEAIRARFPNEADALIQAMWSDTDIFLDADGTFRLREDFVAGNAWEKIDALDAAIKAHPGDEYAAHRARWQAGIEALRDAAGWVPIEDADVSPQAVWIPEEIVNRWADTFRQAPNGYRYGRNENGKWGLIAEEEAREWNWKKRTYIESAAGEWREHNDEFVYFLNSQKQRGKYTDTDTYNKNALAAFKTWLATDEQARAEIEEIYNRQFNTELGAPNKTYAVNIEGWNPNIELKPWQWQSIHHLYRQGKGISALGTGYGKTYAGIGLFALLRQEGKVHRAFFQVPNNKVKDWVEDFGKAMPGLKVGAIDPDGEGMAKQENRFAAYQKLASGDYDVIIMPETSASEIQLTEEADAAIVADYADQLASKKSEEGTTMGVPSEKEKKKTAREQQKAKDRAESSLTGGKKNATITFEEFGCDAVFADEMHRMKNLFTSSLSRETGMNDGRRSDRALSFFKKCEAVRRANDGKNVFGLTATPLTNSPLEYYNMMQHIAPEMLKTKNIASIDQFIQTFADIVEGNKFDPFSGQLKKGKVLVGFKNLKSLQDMFFKFTDLQNDPTKIGLKKPTPNNKANILPKSDDQVAVVKQIAAEFERYKQMSADERADVSENNFTFYTRMRTASLDLELYDPEGFKGWKNPKIEKMADNALDIYNARGGGQVIFCDRVLSGDGSFNMHEKIKKALVARGFKEDEIVIVNGLTKGGGKASDAALERLVSDAIDGYNGKYDKQGNLVVAPKYKVIIGTTQTIGEGVNLQKNSAALHHVDIPFRPSDFIQRNGRIDRQGNKQSTVELHSYAATGTIDNYSMALVTGKEGWINQLLKTKSNVFTNTNGDGMDMEEILMTLTEEWGDKAGAEEKRTAIEAKKTEAIRQENIKKSGEYLKQLSLMRGALAAYQGDKGSRDYQNRLRKIDNIEAALRNNPEFHAAEILGADGVPFIYHEGTGKVVRKGDLYLDKGRVYRVSGFNHKKRTFEISSAITGEVAGDENAYAASKEYSYNRDRSFFVDNPTPEVVDRYIALTVPEQFHQRPIEFKRDNYADFVAMHAGNYSTKVHPIVRSEDGKVRLASYYGEDYPLVNPYSDEGRAEIVSALEAGKLTASNYRQMEEEYGDLGGGEKARAVQLREFEAEPGAKAALAAIPKVRPSGDGWISLRELANAMPVEDGVYLDEYKLKRLFDSHPDAETSLQRFIGSTDYAVRFKQGMQKSLHYGKMVSEGGRVYVLLERGR